MIHRSATWFSTALLALAFACATLLAEEVNEKCLSAVPFQNVHIADSY